MTYFEQLRLGRWMPCKSPTAPRIKDGREITGENTKGSRIRGVTDVPSEHDGLRLAELQAVYGGKL